MQVEKPCKFALFPQHMWNCIWPHGSYILGLYKFQNEKVYLLALQTRIVIRTDRFDVFQNVAKELVCQGLTARCWIYLPLWKPQLFCVMTLGTWIYISCRFPDLSKVMRRSNLCYGRFAKELEAGCM